MNLLRLIAIQRILLRYGLDQLVPATVGTRLLHAILWVSPGRWSNFATRSLPRGERIRRALEELGPVFVKFGQMISTRRDLLADDIAVELEKLQDRVPPFPSASARQIVAAALGDAADKVFASFAPEALASASVAQVHSARLHSGESVVVKILRPGIDVTIRRDLALMYLLADLLERYWSQGRRLRPRAIVSEFEKTIFDELDLVREAANAAQLRRNFADSDTLTIPEVHWDYTRKNVLVLEKISGVRVSDIDTLHAHQVNMKLLAERGVEIFFTQVFRDNFFHADMHPGNIFVNPENPADPRYIAVDFGIIGTLSRNDRHYLAENLLAFFKRDYLHVAQLHADSGWVPEGTNVAELESAIRVVCEPIFEKPLEEISLGNVLLRLFQTAQRFDMEVQPQLVLLQKTLLNIEGLGRQLYPRLDLWQTAKPFLERWMGEQKGPAAIFKKIGQQAPEWAGVLVELPLLLHGTLRKIAATSEQVSAQKRELQKLRQQLHDNNRRKNRTMIGSTLLIGGLIIYGLDGYQPAIYAGAPLLSWVMVGMGLLVLVATLR